MDPYIYWLLGALVTLAGVLFAVAHGAIMRRLENIESRTTRIEDLLLSERKE